MKRLLGSLLGLLCTQVCWMKGQQVEQSPRALTPQEGENCDLQCNLSTSTNNLQWFYQNPDGRLITLFSNPSGTKQSGRLKSTTDAKERRSSLHISSSQTTDSGTYFCAVNNNNDLRFGAGTRLTVKPIIENPEPAVYQLRDPKSSNNSICLFTDFSSQSNVSQKTEPGLFISDPTVLDMKSMDFKSNGALAWGTQTNFGCGAAFEKEGDNHSDVTCDAKLVEKSFETDMNLNFQNLSVMGLRIFLLKVAGFNLLMTLRLWSS